MAKKGPRVLIGLVCDVCKSQNYVVEKNKLNTQASLKLKKYCKNCRKHTVHKEKKKL
ncbi:50S ribosomal protein L33 [Candidatus Roizmanbacteria bacterium RIFCSPHIGHO2_02_FULL_37_15]|uniref:Large ribosomal subunit protein bL33 n=1 Tax=Candidatus Roizmanbacteria bacterium RIFCSPLOWO2_01_FULL_37_16 TaxID=1802058 RepID=A0A1F7IQV6_9BACT|nr:MAG: 50S ribosomal protein L33 [Candidatus Roizmanbacteria bacterium RIFCSPHIGHO2_01_FULL_37_16b]OGK20762.1 MAG: 50S ribosomal protein L33 [Candidatus Roizmanbacteria bacterium RIFCSPHIGHO2_02_FULL_37_15]OGK33048.1 MAG: 50S ribosomal protein L33 [Candidatus Roizmanbacteria bacterium RIFCSPHIGHO2_12_FULL_36_11]OGK45755.1 MAG: 50S ribosomal protein L33 [Candidatus Roizmanbacteria bacterium RIFCSPLOWO2_01_FULL_37_16]OGK56087.1 MAG: 50S ribosomal protein L33 [Candidatus Roizmanbacteria bacterium